MSRWREVLLRPDVLADLHVYGGLLLVAVGLWHLSRPITLIVLGLALVGLGLLPLRRKT